MWLCATSAWRARADESDGSRCGPRHAFAPLDRHASEGPGRNRRPHASGDYARTAAEIRYPRCHHQCASLLRHDDRIPESEERFRDAHSDFAEDVLLDTGGGLKKASWFFRHDTEPFV